MRSDPLSDHALDQLRPDGVGRQLRCRCSPVEREAFEDAARLCGLTLSAWVRMQLREAAERRLIVAGRAPGWVG